MQKIIKKIFDKKAPPVLIAEISANHNGSIKKAKKLILTAKNNGADLVKLQTYEPRNMTINSAKKDIPVIEKKSVKKSDNKSAKTIQDLDREKLEKKFSKGKKETLN